MIGLRAMMPPGRSTGVRTSGSMLAESPGAVAGQRLSGGATCADSAEQMRAAIGRTLMFSECIRMRFPAAARFLLAVGGNTDQTDRTRMISQGEFTRVFD